MGYIFGIYTLSDGDKVAYAKHDSIGANDPVDIVSFFHGDNGNMWNMNTIGTAGNNYKDGVIYSESLPLHIKNGTTNERKVLYLFPYGSTSNNWGYSSYWFDIYENFVNNIPNKRKHWHTGYSAGTIGPINYFAYAGVLGRFEGYMLTSGISGGGPGSYGGWNNIFNSGKRFAGRHGTADNVVPYNGVNGQKAFLDYVTSTYTVPSGRYQISFPAGGDHGNVTANPAYWNEMQTFMAVPEPGGGYVEPTTSANNAVAPVPVGFRPGTNPGYYGNHLNNQNLADLAATSGNLRFRPGMFYNFMKAFGNGFATGDYQYFINSKGMNGLTLFMTRHNNLDATDDPDRATETYTNQDGSGTVRSKLFAGMYLPFFNSDGSINTNNKAADFFYRVATTYKDFIKIFEIWNEPDLTYYDPGQWTNRDPYPYELVNCFAPMEHYVRLSRIAYRVIKSVIPDAVIVSGGLGHPEYMTRLFDKTDNPSGGAVTTDYPLKYGAYIDELSYHRYPQYYLKQYNSQTGDFDYFAHSDSACDDLVTIDTQLQALMAGKGYNGTTYPRKQSVITETNVSRSDHYIYNGRPQWRGSNEMSANFIVKAYIVAQQRNINPFITYELGEIGAFGTQDDEYDMMGFWQDLTNTSRTVANAQKTPQGISSTVYYNQIHAAGFVYNAADTATLGLSGNVRGAAFRNGSNLKYILWAKTTLDKDETASATYQFPTGTKRLNIVSRDGVASTKSGRTANLTGQPQYLQASTVDSPPTGTITGPNSGNEATVIVSTISASDPDNDEITTSITQVEGPTVQISPASGGASFTSQISLPAVTGNQQVRLRATFMANGASSTADYVFTIVDTTAPPDTQAPDVSITPDFQVKGGQGFSVTSNESDNVGISSAIWERESGPAVTIVNPNNTTINPVAPNVATQQVLVLRRTVKDAAGNTTVRRVNVTIIPKVTPVPNAGQDITIQLTAGQTTANIPLNGSVQSDPDSNYGTAKWTVLSGSATIQNDTSLQATAPNAPAGNYTFRLTFTGTNGNTQTDDVNATVTAYDPPPNTPPTGTAGSSETFKYPATGYLRGMGSDADNDPLTYKWRVISGNGIAIQNDTAASATFTYPSQNQSAQFEIRIDDGKGGVATYTVTHTLQAGVPVIGPPTAESIAPIEITLPSLNGNLYVNASSNEPITYQWVQTSGKTATINSANSQSTPFTVPGDGEYTFEVTVTGESGQSVKRIASVSVAPPAIPNPGVPDDYGIKYTGDYTTPKGSKGSVFFYQRGFSGLSESLELAGNGVELEYQNSGEQFHTPIIASKQTTRFYSSDAVNGLEFFTGDDTMFFVQCFVAQEVAFQGWVIPDETSSYDSRGRFLITVTATEGFTLLKSELFLDENQKQYKNKKSVIAVLQIILLRLGYGTPISILSPMFEDQIMDDRSHQWEKIMLQMDEYYDTNNSPQDCYTILEKICVAFNLSLRKVGYTFYFVCHEGLERLETQEEISLYEYTQNGQLNPPAKTNYPAIVSAFRIGSAPRLAKNKPFRIVDGITKFDKISNLYTNSDFEESPVQDAMPQGWGKVAAPITAGLKNIGIEAYSGDWVFQIRGGSGRFTSNGTEDPNLPFGYVQITPFEVYKNGLKGKISFASFVSDNGGVSDITNRYVVWGVFSQNGNGENSMWYSAVDGSWSTTKRLNYIDAAYAKWEMQSIETTAFPSAGFFSFVFFKTMYQIANQPLNVNENDFAYSNIDDFFISLGDAANPQSEIVGETNRYMNASSLFKTSKKEVELQHYSWPNNKYITGAVTVNKNGSDLPATNWRTLPFATPILPLYLQKLVTQYYLNSAIIPQDVWDATIQSDTATFYNRYSIDGLEGVFFAVSFRADLTQSTREVVLMRVLPQFSGTYTFEYYPEVRQPARRN